MTTPSSNIVSFRPTKDATFKVDVAGTIANPGPLGLFAFALTTALLSSANANIVEGGFLGVVWSYALVWGGATQWTAGILEFFKKNIFGGTVFCTYGAFWIGLGLFQILVSAKVITVDTSIQAGMTAYFACFGIITIVYGIGSTRVNVALTLVFVFLIPTFFLLLGGLYNESSNKAGGWFGIICAALAFYTGSATFLNEVFGSVILPLGSPDILYRSAAAQKLLATQSSDTMGDDEVTQAGKKV